MAMILSSHQVRQGAMSVSQVIAAGMGDRGRFERTYHDGDNGDDGGDDSDTKIQIYNFIYT
jgi:hypothetical protein